MYRFRGGWRGRRLRTWLIAIRLGCDVRLIAGVRGVVVLQSCLWKSDRRESGWMFSGQGWLETKKLRSVRTVTLSRME